MSKFYKQVIPLIIICLMPRKKFLDNSCLQPASQSCFGKCCNMHVNYPHILHVEKNICSSGHGLILIGSWYVCGESFISKHRDSARIPYLWFRMYAFLFFRTTYQIEFVHIYARMWRKILLNEWIVISKPISNLLIRTCLVTLNILK